MSNIEYSRPELIQLALNSQTLSDQERGLRNFYANQTDGLIIEAEKLRTLFPY